MPASPISASPISASPVPASPVPASPVSTSPGHDPLDAEIGARIKAARLGRRMSLATLGEAAGVSFQQVQKYEAGLYRVSAPTLSRIAARLGVSAGALMGEADAPGVDLLDTPGAVPLLAAYAALRDPAARQALLRLAQAAADDAPDSASEGVRARPVPAEPRSFAAE